MTTKHLLFLFVLFLLFPLGLAFTIEVSIPDYETTSNPQTPENYSDSLISSPQSWNTPGQPLLNPSDPWSDLRMLIAEGLQGLSESNEALNQLEMELGQLRVETNEQRLLYEESQRLLTSLKQSLADALWAIDVAVDRMEDAEAYAWWIDAQNELLREQVRQSRRSGPVGFAFGGVSFGIGVPLIVEGIRSDNSTMTWAGAGTIAGTGLIWAAGHYIFKWW